VRERERHRPTRGVPRRQRAERPIPGPTPPQLAKLAELGVTTPPATRADASRAIERLIAKRQRTEPPTARQLRKLRELRVQGSKPQTKLEAARLIQRALSADGRAHEARGEQTSGDRRRHAVRVKRAAKITRRIDELTADERATWGL
jgi:hypothetical protein